MQNLVITILVIFFVLASCAKPELSDSTTSSFKKDSCDEKTGANCQKVIDTPDFKNEINCTLTASPPSVTRGGTVTITLNVTDPAVSALVNDLHIITVPTGTLKFISSSDTNYVAKVSGPDGKMGQCNVMVTIIDPNNPQPPTNPPISPPTNPTSPTTQTLACAENTTCSCPAGFAVKSVSTNTQYCYYSNNTTSIICRKLNVVGGGIIYPCGCIFVCQK